MQVRFLQSDLGFANRNRLRDGEGKEDGAGDCTLRGRGWGRRERRAWRAATDKRSGGGGEGGELATRWGGGSWQRRPGMVPTAPLTNPRQRLVGLDPTDLGLIPSRIRWQANRAGDEGRIWVRSGGSVPRAAGLIRRPSPRLNRCRGRNQRWIQRRKEKALYPSKKKKEKALLKNN